MLRYGLVLVVGWIGLMKFTGYEAKGIEPLVAHSPLMGWMYSFLSVQTFSHVLGVVEVTIAILIGLRHWSAKASAPAIKVREPQQHSLGETDLLHVGCKIPIV